MIDRLIFYSRKALSRGKGNERELDHKRVGVYGHRIVHPFLETRRRNRPIWPFDSDQKTINRFVRKRVTTRSVVHAFSPPLTVETSNW